MNRIWKIIGHPNLLKILSVIALVVYALLLIFNTSNKFVFHNNDNYKGNFLRFLNLGYYDAVSEGTTILYNLFLKGFYSLTNNVETSFILLNSLSLIFLVVFGFYFLKKQIRQINIHFTVLFGLYLFFTINLRSFAAASNDTFLGVFIIVLLYLLIQKLFDPKNQYLTFSLIGFILALCFSIRMTAILLIPLIAFAFIIWFIDSNEVVFRKILKILASFLTFIVFISIIHYPSLKENNKLSSYDKVPKNIKVNWTQRNYLGLKKIEKGEEAPNRDAIWHNTKFDEVVKYLEENGQDSLPKTFYETFKRDPMLVLKMFAYNFIFTVLRLFRFWGFLSFLLIIPWLNLKKLKQGIFNKENLASNLFLFYMLMLTFVCFTFIEFRWFIGYEILIPIAVLIQIQRMPFFIKYLNTNFLFSISLLFITLFNLRSIFNLL